jgi:hypothetical protein
LGQSDESRTVLGRAVQLSPSAGFEKYMYLGQVCEGEDAIQAYRAGIEILERDAAAAAAGSRERDELSAQLCSALCALAEHQVLEAGDGDKLKAAAPDCEALLRRAMAADASSPEPEQVRETFLLVLSSFCFSAVHLLQGKN